MMTTCGIINEVENAGRFSLSIYNSPPRRPAFSTNKGTNWWAVIFGDTMTTHKCSTCGMEKSISEFYKRKDGRPIYQCSECERKSVLSRSFPPKMDGTPLEKWFKSLCIDHNHVTGKVRGILCKSCNLLIGNAKDNVDILKSAIVYLTSV